MQRLSRIVRGPRTELGRFFSEKPREEGRNASDYVSDFEAPDQTRLKQALARLERQILDVTSLRPTDPQEKFNTGDARELYAWIVPAILRFQGQLGPSYRASLDAPGSVEALTGSTASFFQPD